MPKSNTALVLVLILLCSGLILANNGIGEIDILVGSGLIQPNEAYAVTKADDVSPYELASLVGRAWKRVTGNKIDSNYDKLVVDLPALINEIPEIKARCPEVTKETIETLMNLTFKYRHELNDLGYGFYLGQYAVYQEKNQVALYSLWDTDSELGQVFGDMLRPFVASYTEELTDWARFRLEYVDLSELDKKELSGEVQLGKVSLGGALSSSTTQPYRVQAAWKVGPVELGASYNSRNYWSGSKPFDIPELGFSLKLGEVELATYWDKPFYSYTGQDGEKVYVPEPPKAIPPDAKEQIELPQVTSLVVGIPIWQWATLKAGLLYGGVKDEEIGMATTKGATAGIKIDLSSTARIEADYQYYNRENENQRNTTNLKLGYGLDDKTYINLAYRLVTSSEKSTGKVADENLATAEISIQF
ncbi:MAG TPA: hypothetical protein GX522_06750 [Firmicutes bacterium]|jgi:hypothetical protein|nr:hypothetical protein [Bacillota bacterium]